MLEKRFFFLCLKNLFTLISVCWLKTPEQLVDFSGFCHRNLRQLWLVKMILKAVNVENHKVRVEAFATGCSVVKSRSLRVFAKKRESNSNRNPSHFCVLTLFQDILELHEK